MEPFIIFIILSIIALISTLFGVAHLILYRIFETFKDRLATTEAIFIGTKTDVYHGKKSYYPTFEYTVNHKKYRKTVSSYGHHRNSEAVYLKAFPRIAYIKYAGNDFKENAVICFGFAVFSLFIGLICLFCQ